MNSFAAGLIDRSNFDLVPFSAWTARRRLSLVLHTTTGPKSLPVNHNSAVALVLDNWPVTRLAENPQKIASMFSAAYTSLPANSRRKPKCRAATLKLKDGVRPSGPAPEKPTHRAPIEVSMENDVTRSTAARALPPRPVLPCDAYCKNHPPDASQNCDLSSQLAETGPLKTPSSKTSHTPKTCVTRLRLRPSAAQGRLTSPRPCP